MSDLMKPVLTSMSGNGAAEDSGGFALPSPRLPTRISGKSPVHRRPRTTDHFTQGPGELITLLKEHADKGEWGPVVHVMHLASFLATRQPHMAKQLAAAGAPGALLDIMEAIIDSDHIADAKEMVLIKATAMLRLLVDKDQDACMRALVAPQGVAVLSHVLCSSAGGSIAKRYAAELVRKLISSGPAWRAPWLNESCLEGLPQSLHDHAAACDVIFVQEVLWALVGLLDAAVSATNEALPDTSGLHNLLATLVPLLQVLRLPCHSHLGHVAALVIRNLHVLAAGDDVSKQKLGDHDVVALLVDTIRTERASQIEQWERERLDVETDDSESPSGASYMSRSWSLRAEAKLTSGVLTRTGSTRPSGLLEGAGGSTPRARLHGVHGGECAPQAPCMDPLQHVSAWDRLMAALLLRAILDQPSATAAPPGSSSSGAPSAVVVWMRPSVLAAYTLLLPLIIDDHTPESCRLCVVKESVVAIKVLVASSEENQARAAECGGIPVLVHLVATGDVTLAWQSGDALSALASPQHLPELLSLGCVEEVTHLMQESADALHQLTVKKQLQDYSISGTVSHLPAPHAAYAYRRKPRASTSGSRVQLLGVRQALGFAGSSCMYTSHDASSVCDYCVPSACLRALLRMLGAAVNLQSAQYSEDEAGDLVLTSKDVAEQFVSAGGLYALFLLLHHEMAGGHHSKMAGSLVSLLNLVLDTGLDVQDEVYKVGGLALLVSLLEGVAKGHGVTDIFQLRVQCCMALERLLSGNAANKLAVRERGLITLLSGILQSALDPQASQVLDDKEQVITSVLDLLTACIADSTGNQEALIQAGGLRHINQIFESVTPAPEQKGRKLLGLMKGIAGRAGAAAGGGVAKGTTTSNSPLAAAVRCVSRLVQGSQAAQLLMLSGPLIGVLIQLSEEDPTSTIAQDTTALVCQLAAVHPNGKAHALKCGFLKMMLKMLSATQKPGPHLAAACQGLYAACVGDVDHQNEVIEGGGLQLLENIILECPPYAVHALWALCCLLHGNSFAKNAVRQHAAGLIKLLLGLLTPAAAAVQRPEASIAAAHALAQLCQSNHSNQELLVQKGVMTSIADILQECLTAPASSAHASLDGTPGVARGSTSGTSAMPSRSSSNVNVSKALLAARSPALHKASSKASLIESVLRLTAALLEFNTANQKLVRETGCLSHLATLLVQAGQLHDLGSLKTAGLMSCLAAACTVISAACQDCHDNQAALVAEYKEDVSAALIRLLNVDDPTVSLEAARALEHMVIRTDLVHDPNDQRADFEADAIQSLVHVLHTRAGKPVSGPTTSTSAAPAFATQPGMLALSSMLIVQGDSAAPSAQSVAATAASVKEAAAVLATLVNASAQAAADAQNDHTSIAGTRSASLEPSHRSQAASAAKSAVASAFSRLFARRPASAAASSPGVPPSPNNPHDAPPASPTVLPHPTAQQAAASDAASAAASTTAAADLSVVASADGSAVEESGNKETTPEPQLAVMPSSVIAKDSQIGTKHTEISARDSPAISDVVDGKIVRGLSSEQMESSHALDHDEWMRLAGQSAGAFEPVAELISQTPWRPFKVQVSWLLFLLGAKSHANRQLLARMERSVVSPLALQLANAENFFANDQAAAALTGAEPLTTSAQLPISTLAQDPKSSFLYSKKSSLASSKSHTHQGAGATGVTASSTTLTSTLSASSAARPNSSGNQPALAMALATGDDPWDARLPPEFLEVPKTGNTPAVQIPGSMPRRVSTGNASLPRASVGHVTATVPTATPAPVSNTTPDAPPATAGTQPPPSSMPSSRSADAGAGGETGDGVATEHSETSHHVDALPASASEENAGSKTSAVQLQSHASEEEELEFLRREVELLAGAPGGGQAT